MNINRFKITIEPIQDTDEHILKRLMYLYQTTTNSRDRLEISYYVRKKFKVDIEKIDLTKLSQEVKNDKHRRKWN